MAPALQQWMAVVLGLLLLRSEAFQVIYAMRSQPQQQQAISCQKLAASRKGGGICSAAAALALGLLDGFLDVLLSSVATHTSPSPAVHLLCGRYAARLQSLHTQIVVLTAPYCCKRHESCERLRSASSRAASLQPQQPHHSRLHSFIRACTACIRADEAHWSSHRCSQPQKLSTWC